MTANHKHRRQYIGQLANGEAIYIDADNNILIEKDYSYLVAATAAEWEEANRIYNKSKTRSSDRICLGDQLKGHNADSTR